MNTVMTPHNTYWSPTLYIYLHELRDEDKMDPPGSDKWYWKRPSKNHISILGNMNPASAVTWTFNFLQKYEH